MKIKNLLIALTGKDHQNKVPPLWTMHIHAKTYNGCLV